jgi:ubiquitin
MQFTTAIVALFAATAFAAPTPAESINKRCDYTACGLALGPAAATCALSEEAFEIPCVVAVLASMANPPASCSGC